MYTMKRTFFLFFLLITCAVLAQDKSSQEKIKYYTEKIEKYLDKEKVLSGYYSLEADAINIYSSAENKANKKAEFSLKFSMTEYYVAAIKEGNGFEFYKKGDYKVIRTGRLPEQQKTNNEFPLQGIKIAIDPGHIAGDHLIGDLEKKHLKFAKDSLKELNDSIEISEGILTYATAILLKEKLEAQGANVFITRRCLDCTAFGRSYEDWKKTEYFKTVDTLYTLGKISLSQKKFFYGKNVQDRDIFRVIFRDWELIERGKIINNYKPDLAVIIHYNVDETNLEWLKPTNKNFNMCFVGGAFMKGDLLSMEKRFEFLRLMITDDIEESVKLSSSVLKQMETTLKVPTAGMQDAKYLREGCLQAAPGVYCRNLQLPRYIHCPLVYGETLYQDNINECQLLNKEKDKTKNERVKQVADAYYSGIINYISGIK